MQPWQVALRTFLVAGEDGYTAMPGGLCRVSAGGDWLGDSMASGEGSKDVWVLSEGPVAPVSLLHPAGQALPLRRSGNELPSRVADNLFWLGRHAERAEGKLRLLRSLLVRLSSESETETLPEIGVLFQALAGQGQQGADAIAPHPLLRPQVLEDELFAWLFDAQRPDSLRSSLSSMHQVAAMVRDRISVDSWRILYRIEQDFRRPPLPRDFVQPGDMLALLNQVLMNLVGLQRFGDGEHDPHAGLAILGHGPPLGTGDPHLLAAAQHAGRAGQQRIGGDRSGAGNRRQLDDLSLALSDHAASGAGVGSAGDRRIESAFGGVSTGRAGRPRRELAARSDASPSAPPSSG